jgi:hypothetical protein
MKRIQTAKNSIVRRGAGVLVAAVLAALLAGCVVYPAGPGYYGHPYGGGYYGRGWR